jgi:transposase
VAVDVAISKYCDHLPLERQKRIFERAGLKVSSQTLWDQIEALARVLKPTYEAFSDRILAEPLVHADETRWPLLAKGQQKSLWTWCLASEDMVFYRILDNRGKDAASTVLQYYDGIVVADGYSAYQSLARAGPGFTLAHCWAHVRRKLVEIEELGQTSVTPALDLIAQLYAVERQVPAPGPEETAEQRAERLALRLRLRQEHSRPLVEQIAQWVELQKALPKSSLGRAIGYLRELWNGLTRFLDDPQIPLDNNRVERALRSVVLGRKNHLGSRSQRGCEVAALFYTLLGTAQLRGVDPRAYLTRALYRALQDPTAITYP